MIHRLESGRPTSSFGIIELVNGIVGDQIKLIHGLVTRLDRLDKIHFMYDSLKVVIGKTILLS